MWKECSIKKWRKTFYSRFLYSMKSCFSYNIMIQNNNFSFRIGCIFLSLEQWSPEEFRIEEFFLKNRISCRTFLWWLGKSFLYFWLKNPQIRYIYTNTIKNKGFLLVCTGNRRDTETISKDANCLCSNTACIFCWQHYSKRVQLCSKVAISEVVLGLKT